MRPCLQWLAFICLVATPAMGQNETSQWFFGRHSGLNFLNNPPTAQPVSSITAWEAASSVSDGAGNLLFYTSGDTIWNKLHQPMANGVGLSGSKDCMQHIIVKQPGTQTIYYVFTSDHPVAPNPPGFRYSIVDMSLAAGNGSVISKNHKLFDSGTEQVGAVKHCNGSDIWIVGHEYLNNTFACYELSANGLNSVPVKSNLGPTFNFTTYHIPGMLKISPTGQRIAMGIMLSNDFALFDFDNATGALSNYRLLTGDDLTQGLAYGCEFSPDGSKLFGVANYKLYQWDICGNSLAAIMATKDSIAVPNGQSRMQLTQDGKIYAVNQNTIYSLASIDNPNLPLPSCNYVSQAVILGKQATTLPTFMSSYFRAPLSAFAHTVNCGTVSFAFSSSLCPAQSRSVSAYQWIFGDPSSGTSNTSSLVNSSHVYAAPGDYTVGLVLQYGCGNDTIKQVVKVTGVPAIGVAGNFTICKGDNRVFTASGASTYSWNGTAGPPTTTLSPTNTSVYTVSGTGSNGCTGSKDFTVTVSECLGLRDQETEGINDYLFPNPGNGVFNIQSATAGDLRTFDATGRLIFEMAFTPGLSEIDLRRYSDGIYFVEITTRSGGKFIRLQKASD